MLAYLKTTLSNHVRVELETTDDDFSLLEDIDTEREIQWDQYDTPRSKNSCRLKTANLIVISLLLVF